MLKYPHQALPVLILLIITVGGAGRQTDSLDLSEATIAQMQAWMASGRYSSRRLTELYLRRIDELDRKGPQLRSISEVNPDAIAIATSLDEERHRKVLAGRCMAFQSSSRTTSIRPIA